jgi:hypothetical protein
LTMKGDKPMSSIVAADRGQVYWVVHPLDDEPEEKCSTEGLGLMPMTRTTKVALLSLRCYIFLMIPVILAFILRTAGVF